MKLFLLILGHEVDDENTVVSPIVTPAVDLAQAEAIGERIADHLGVDVLEAPVLIGETKCGNSGAPSSTIEGGC